MDDQQGMGQTIEPRDPQAADLGSADVQAAAIGETGASQTVNGQVVGPDGKAATPPITASPPPQWGQRGKIVWREWVKPLLIIGLVMFSFRSAVADWNDVPTGSMKPTILEGDRIFINKLAYDLKFPFTRFRLAQWDDPQWGDVVVLLSPEDGKRLVKRVVGLPGDVIEFYSDSRLYRNGKPAYYSDLPTNPVRGKDPLTMILSEEVNGKEHPVMVRRGFPLHSGAIPVGCQGETEADRAKKSRRSRWFCVLGDEQFFVMGDNRNNSRDSRYFGPVDRKAILGQATAVALSFDRSNYFKPRLERFFSELP